MRRRMCMHIHIHIRGSVCPHRELVGLPSFLPCSKAMPPKGSEKAVSTLGCLQKRGMKAGKPAWHMRAHVDNRHYCGPWRDTLTQASNDLAEARRSTTRAEYIEGVQKLLYEAYWMRAVLQRCKQHSVRCKGIQQQCRRQSNTYKSAKVKGMVGAKAVKRCGKFACIKNESSGVDQGVQQ